jgi:hypothetical protein
MPLIKTVENKDNKRGIGVAFDIGTTTVVGSSVDLSTGGVLSTISAPNPQARWGRDVISRINAIVERPALLDEMRRAVVGACNGIISALRLTGPVTEITAAGNPVMESILLGISPEPLSRVPYKPAFTGAQRVEAKARPRPPGLGSTHFLSSGFVGGDAVAGPSLRGGQNNDRDTRHRTSERTARYALFRREYLRHERGRRARLRGRRIKIRDDGPKRGDTGRKDRRHSLTLDVIGGVAPVGICGAGS